MTPGRKGVSAGEGKDATADRRAHLGRKEGKHRGRAERKVHAGLEEPKGGSQRIGGVYKKKKDNLY